MQPNVPISRFLSCVSKMVCLHVY